MIEAEKYLSSEELAALIKEHQGDRIFRKNEKRETILASWLTELRSRQALYVAEKYLAGQSLYAGGRSIGRAPLSQTL